MAEICYLARSTHGASGICGMSLILQPLKDLEQHSAAGQMEQAQTSFETVMREFARIREYIDARLQLPAGSPAKDCAAA